MKLAQLWREYYGYADEREEGEANRISRRAFGALVLLNLLLAYFLMQLSQVATVHGMESEAYDMLGMVAFVLCLYVAGTCLYSSVSQTNKGIVGSSRFANTDAFPWGFALAIAALSSGVTCLALWILRCTAEIILVGVGHVYWLGNVAVALFFFPLLFFGVAVALRMTFRDAKKAQEKLLNELED